MPQLVDTPASDTSYDYTQLAYLEIYDAVLNDDYAFVAYKEADKSGASWRVRIKSRHTAGAVFEPDAMKSNARSANAQGKPYFIWGYNFEPSAGDPRCIEFRVHQVDGKPAKIEIYAQMRKADNTPGEQKSVSFAWPG